MSSGITTIVSQSAIPEKATAVTERAAENKQQAIVTVSQTHAEERVKVVQKTDKVELIQRVPREKEEKEGRKNDEKDKKKKSFRSHIDLEA